MNLKYIVGNQQGFPNKPEDMSSSVELGFLFSLYMKTESLPISLKTYQENNKNYNHHKNMSAEGRGVFVLLFLQAACMITGRCAVKINPGPWTRRHAWIILLYVLKHLGNGQPVTNTLEGRTDCEGWRRWPGKPRNKGQHERLPHFLGATMCAAASLRKGRSPCARCATGHLTQPPRHRHSAPLGTRGN